MTILRHRKIGGTSTVRRGMGQPLTDLRGYYSFGTTPSARLDTDGSHFCRGTHDVLAPARSGGLYEEIQQTKDTRQKKRREKQENRHFAFTPLKFAPSNCLDLAREGTRKVKTENQTDDDDGTVHEESFPLKLNHRPSAALRTAKPLEVYRPVEQEAITRQDCADSSTSGTPWAKLAIRGIISVLRGRRVAR